MNYNGYKNVSSNGKVIDSHKRVEDSYGKHIPSSHVNEAGVVVPQGSVMDNDWDFDEENDKSFTVPSTPTPISIKIMTAFVVIPVILHRVFDIFTPLMESLLIPSLTIILGVTLIIPSAREELSKKNLTLNLYNKKKRKYRSLWVANLLSSFIVSYPIISPILYEWTESVADLFSGNKSIIVSIFSVIILVLLYFIRFLVAIFLIPIIQQVLWKYISNFSGNQTVTKVAKWYMN